MRKYWNLMVYMGFEFCGNDGLYFLFKRYITEDIIVRLYFRPDRRIEIRIDETYYFPNEQLNDDYELYQLLLRFNIRRWI